MSNAGAPAGLDTGGVSASVVDAAVAAAREALAGGMQTGFGPAAAVAVVALIAALLIRDVPLVAEEPASGIARPVRRDASSPTGHPGS